MRQITTIILLIIIAILLWFNISDNVKNNVCKNKYKNMTKDYNIRYVNNEESNDKLIIDTITKMIMIRDNNSNIYSITSEILNIKSIDAIPAGNYYGVYNKNTLLIYDYTNKYICTLYIEEECNIRDYIFISSDDIISIKVL